MTKTNNKQTDRLKKCIRDIPDFPKTGIIFKDITPLLKDGKAFRAACRAIAEPFLGLNIDHVIGIESRGFILSPLVAYQLKAGFIPVRKKGKLPARVERVSYDLEYGQDHLEIHADAIGKGHRVLIVDDVLATGGTAEAVIKLVQKLGGDIAGVAFLIELAFLHGREKLKIPHVHSVIRYE